MFKRILLIGTLSLGLMALLVAEASAAIYVTQGGRGGRACYFSEFDARGGMNLKTPVYIRGNLCVPGYDSDGCYYDCVNPPDCTGTEASASESTCAADLLPESALACLNPAFQDPSVQGLGYLPRLNDAFTAVEPNQWDKNGRATVTPEVSSDYRDFSEDLYGIWVYCNEDPNPDPYKPEICYDNPGIPEGQPVFVQFWRNYENCNPDQTNEQLIDNCPWALTAFRKAWFPDLTNNADFIALCGKKSRGSYATPWEIRLPYFTIVGEVLENCFDASGNPCDPSDPDCCDSASSSDVWQFMTDLPVRSWPLETLILFNGSPIGAPITSREDYSARKRKLNILESVLSNDHNFTTDCMSAVLVEGPYPADSITSFDLADDGTISFEPAEDFLRGKVCFKYLARNANGDGNVVEDCIEVH